MNNEMVPLFSPLPEGVSCKGLVFRCEINEYFSGERIVQKTTYRLLKRKSCPGCDQCGFMRDDLNEMISGQYGMIWPDNPKHGALYSPRVTNVARDWETGYVDDWDIILEEVVE